MLSIQAATGWPGPAQALLTNVFFEAPQKHFLKEPPAVWIFTAKEYS
jgi:hypothetical protein